MSTQPAPLLPPRPTEIKIYSHSSLFYWWPVWLLGYILALAVSVSAFGALDPLINMRFHKRMQELKMSAACP